MMKELRELMSKFLELQVRFAETSAVNDHKVAQLEARIAELTPLASYGRQFHGHLVEKFIQSKKLLDEVASGLEETLKKTVAEWPIYILQKEVELLEKRVSEKVIVRAGASLLRPKTTIERQLVRTKRKNPLRSKR